METYPEMNREIVKLLRADFRDYHLYAAARIEELEAECERLRECARFAATCCNDPQDRMWHAADNTWWRREGNQWKSTEPPVALVNLEAWLLLRDLRNALAGAMRVIAQNGATWEFLKEMKECGVPDGIGVRANEWLDANAGTETPRT